MKKIQVNIEHLEVSTANRTRPNYIENSGKHDKMWNIFSFVGYSVVLLVITTVMVMEIKNNYHTDFFKGGGTPIDEMYNSIFK